MAFSFARIEMLWGLLLLLPLWWWTLRRQTGEVTALSLRTMVVALLVLALAHPQWAELQEEQTVLFLVDGSWSIHEDQYLWAEQFMGDAVQESSSEDRVGIATFGETIRWQRLPSPLPGNATSTDGGSSVRLGERPGGRYTNFEKALSQAAPVLDPSTSRVVLLSDGIETQGQVRQFLPSLAEIGLPVDIVHLPTTDPGPEVTVTHLQFPNQGVSGSVLQGHVVVHSTVDTPANVRLLADGQMQFEESVQLQSGYNYVPLQWTLMTSGSASLRVEVDAEQDTITANNHWSAAVQVVGPPTVLLAGRQGPETEALSHALGGQGLRVQQVSLDQFPTSILEMQEYSVVILNDIPADGLSSAQHSLLQEYASRLGGGVVAVGGRSSFGLGGYDQSPFNLLLPVQAKKPEELAFPTLSLVIIVDKSGSMSAELPGSDSLTSMDVARQAAFGVVELLLSQERIGVMSFDVATEWVVPMQDVGDRQAVYAALRELQVGTGGTNIYPSLVDAFAVLVDEETSVRHVILLSDGVSQPAEYGPLLEEYREENITLSTVSIGPATDLQLMARLAAETGGKHYYAEDVRSVPQIMAAEAERILGSPLIEEPTTIRPTGSSPLTMGLPWEEVPELKAFAVTTPKDLADVYLIADDNSPLLAGWRFGLGRVMAFASDLGQEFAQAWLDTPYYAQFWNRVIQWASTDLVGQGLQSRFVYQDGTGSLMVDALAADGSYRNHLALEAQIFHEGESASTVSLEQAGPGHYRVDMPLDQEGVYLAVVSGMIDGEPVQQRAFATVPYSPEWGVSSTDNVLLDIADLTGGRALTDPNQVFAEHAHSYGPPRSLWSWVLAVALLLWVLDIAWRQLRRVGEPK